MKLRLPPAQTLNPENKIRRGRGFRVLGLRVRVQGLWV